MNSQGLKKYNIPDKSGVYFFLKGKNILYIGKATSLRYRVKSYFNKDLINSRGPAVLDMVTQSDDLKWEETDSVLEALILESNLIKKYQPKYNTKEKDNKSFNYVCITDENIPKVLVIRGRNIDFAQKSFFSGLGMRGVGSVSYHSKNLFFSEIFGPFPNGSQLKVAMKIIRRIFPYLDNDSNKKNNREFYKQLGLVPSIKLEDGRMKSSFPSGLAPVPVSLVREPDEKKLFSDHRKQYLNNIKNFKLFFQGKKKNVISNLKKEMMICAKKKEFEKAGEIKKRIFALNHINDVALIKEDNLSRDTSCFRIEAYDIAHMNGKNMVGVMTVVENGEVKKSEYKKFIIKTQTNANDTGALEEVFSRRLRHIEWGLPNLIVVDGGKAQINIVKKVLEKFSKNFSSFATLQIVSVLKDERHKAKAIIGDEKIIKKYQKEILLANSESHRFAIIFHKQKRNKNFLNKI